MPGVLWGRQHDWSFWLCPPFLDPPVPSPLTWVWDAEMPDRLLHPPITACCKSRIIQQTWDGCDEHILNCLINKSAAAVKLLLLIQAHDFQKCGVLMEHIAVRCVLFIHRSKFVFFCVYNLNKCTIWKCAKFLTDNFKITIPIPCYSLLLIRKKEHFTTTATEFLSSRGNSEQKCTLTNWRWRLLFQSLCNK